ncbi:MAG: hypothetical protein ACTHLR_11510 [Rhizomicrobium sp.]
MALPANANSPAVEASAKAAPKPRYDITHLAQLHDEARETAVLANLLGRTPYAASALVAGACLTLLSVGGTMPVAEAAIWLALILFAAGAMMRCYMHAIGRPFEHGSLREFAYDLNAICICAGFIWGLGGFLALGPQTPPWMTALCAAGLPAFFAVFLRTREISLGLLAPSAMLFAIAAMFRPLPEGMLAAAFVLIACAAVAGAIFWTDRLFSAPAMPGKLAGAPPI